MKKWVLDAHIIALTAKYEEEGEEEGEGEGEENMWLWGTGERREEVDGVTWAGEQNSVLTLLPSVSKVRTISAG